MDTVGVIIAVASFIGAIVGAARSNLVTARQASQERREARRREALQGLAEVTSALVKASADLEEFQASGEMRTSDRYSNAFRSLGEAKAMMFAIDDEAFRKIATEGIVLSTPYAADWLDRTRKALMDGISRLGS